MLWATIILLLRRYRKTNPVAFQLLLAKLLMAARATALLLLALATALAAHTQTKSRAYNIQQNGKAIGTLQVKEVAVNDRVCFQLSSQVQLRFLIGLQIRAEEEAHFENNILVFSSINRRTNGIPKMNKTIRLQGRSYQVNNDGKKEELQLYPIRQTLLTLYVYEPVALTQVFSDVYQRLVPVQRVAPNHYKVQLPDGAYNEFFYRDGICAKVLLHNPLYKAEIALKN